jgi:hypothetical protein
MAPYRKGRSDIDALALYVWNIDLSEAFYPILQNLEVGLRNKLNDALTISYGDSWWFEDPGIMVDRNARDRVEEAKNRLADNGTSITESGVVSELSFGFWSSLFSNQYEPVIWRRAGLLRNAFPYMSAFIRKRSVLATRFNEIRRFRNRVFHHEPIWHLDLSKEHANIMEALGWLDPCLQKVTATLDRFAAVNNEARQSEIREKLIYACPVESRALVAARRDAAVRAAAVVQASSSESE